MKRLLATFLLFATGIYAVADAQSTSNNPLTMNQWVHLAEDGSLNGRVLLANTNGQASILGSTSVSVRDRSGSTHLGQTDSDGRFKFSGLKPGIYSLIARGANSFASVALHVLPIDRGLDYGFPSVAEISAARIQNATVQMAIARYMPPNLTKNDSSIEIANLEELASRVYGTELSQVVQIDGGMKGRIFRAGAEGTDLPMASRTNVFLFQNGLEVARVLTDDFGRFEIELLPVGHYSLLAIGRDGIGSIGFVLVDQQQAKETARRIDTGVNAETLVMQYGCCGSQNEFAMQIAPMPDVVELVQGPIVQDPCGCSVPAPVPACGCPVPVDPCGCGGSIVAEGAIVEGAAGEGAPVESGIADGVAETGNIAETGIASGGYAGYSGGFGGGGFGGGGGGGGGAGGGLGGLGALGGLGGVLASTAGGGGSGGSGVIGTPTGSTLQSPDPASPFNPVDLDQQF